MLSSTIFGTICTHARCYVRRFSIAFAYAFDVTWYGFCSACTHTRTHTQWFQISLPRQLSTRQLTGNQLKLQITKYGTGNAAKQDPRKISCWSWESSFCQSTKNLDITSRQVSKRKKNNQFGAQFFREHFDFKKSAFRYNENNTHFILRRASTVFDAF